MNLMSTCRLVGRSAFKYADKLHLSFRALAKNAIVTIFRWELTTSALEAPPALV